MRLKTALKTDDYSCKCGILLQMLSTHR